MTLWPNHRLEPCNTSAAYRRHLRHGETPCQSCRLANARRTADHRAVNGRPSRAKRKPQ